MLQKWITLFFLVMTIAVSYVLTEWFAGVIYVRLLQSEVAVTVLYAVFAIAIAIAIGVAEFFVRRISDGKTRYSFRKAISIILPLLILAGSTRSGIAS